MEWEVTWTRERRKKKKSGKKGKALMSDDDVASSCFLVTIFGNIKQNIRDENQRGKEGFSFYLPCHKKRFKTFSELKWRERRHCDSAVIGRPHKREREDDQIRMRDKLHSLLPPPGVSVLWNKQRTTNSHVNYTCSRELWLLFYWLILLLTYCCLRTHSLRQRGCCDWRGVSKRRWLYFRTQVWCLNLLCFFLSFLFFFCN